MGIIVGGPTAFKVRRTGDIVIAYHWVNEEPAMVLFPARPSLGASAFIICMSAAHKYARRDGGPTPYLLKQCATAAKVMAMSVERSTMKRIADVILDGMEDLIKMPPEPRSLPKRKGMSVGEISLKDRASGRVLAEGEIDVPFGMTRGTLH